MAGDYTFMRSADFIWKFKDETKDINGFCTTRFSHKAPTYVCLHQESEHDFDINLLHYMYKMHT